MYIEFTIIINSTTVMQVQCRLPYRLQVVVQGTRCKGEEKTKGKLKISTQVIKPAFCSHYNLHVLYNTSDCDHMIVT